MGLRLQGRAGWVLGVVALVAATSLDCGARSSLDADGLASGSAAGAGSGAGGQGAGGQAPAGCLLELSGEPISVVSFPDRQVRSPSLVVIDGGEPPPASVAIQVFAGGGDSVLHSDIQIARLAVSAPWPSVVQEQAPMLLGIESHGWAEMAHAPGDLDQIAIAWFSDPGFVGRTAFRLLDVPSWSPGPPVDLSFDGSSALALVPGSGVGALGVGYEGDGYAVAWREPFDGDADTHAILAVLDVDGGVVLGPHVQALAAPYPGPSPSLVWSGASYLVATAHPDSLTFGVERIRPASGDALDDSGIEPVWTDERMGQPLRPSLATHGGRTWMLWREQKPEDPSGPRRLLLQELDPQGERLGPVRTLGEVRALGRAMLQAGRFGLTVVYAAHGDPLADDDQPGRSSIVVGQYDYEGTPMAPPIEIPATLVDLYGPPSLVEIANPKALLVSWAGHGVDSGLEEAYLAMLECRDDVTLCSDSSECPADAYCDVTCCGEPGRCHPRPDGCFTDCPSVLACDGASHCNACEARVAGIDVADASCENPSYTAEVLPPAAIDRIAVIKTMPLTNQCVRVVLAHGGSPELPSIYGSDGWVVESARIKDSPGDCSAVTSGEWATATDGVGSVTFATQPMQLYPCQLDIDVTLSFTPVASWTPTATALLVDDLPVAGCDPPP
jgi:hypothetical protein